MKRGIGIKIIKGIGIAAGVILGALLALLLVLTVTEYKPQDTEALSVNGSSSKELSEGDSLTILSWNIGYGALGDNADFFMDGGTHVSTATAGRVNENLDFIIEEVGRMNPDVVFFQEVDTDSKRSHNIDEEQILAEGITGCQNTFAYNYKVLYVPYPLPTIGKVNCGIMTLSSYEVTSSERVQLPCPFSYPIRICNLKRCLMVNRIPVKDSEKELVLVNLHLEAYDDGEGKAAQTEMLKEILEKEAEAGNYVIAGGDFNQTFSNVDTSMYPQVSEELWQPGLIDANEFDSGLQLVMDNSRPSCRLLDRPYEGSSKEDFQYYVIDGFIVSENLTIDSLETQDTGFYATDHNPVVMTVTLE